jgi:hypothetical protein
MKNKLKKYFNSFSERDVKKIIKVINDISIVKLSVKDIIKEKYSDIKTYSHSNGSTIHFNDKPRISITHDESSFDPIEKVYLEKKITSIKIIKLKTNNNLNESI